MEELKIKCYGFPEECRYHRCDGFCAMFDCPCELVRVKEPEGGGEE